MYEAWKKKTFLKNEKQSLNDVWRPFATHFHTILFGQSPLFEDQFYVFWTRGSLQNELICFLVLFQMKWMWLATQAIRVTRTRPSTVAAGNRRRVTAALPCRPVDSPSPKWTSFRSFLLPFHPLSIKHKDAIYWGDQLIANQKSHKHKNVQN